MSTKIQAMHAPSKLGKRVCVIGDEAHMSGYRKVVEEYGSECKFSPGFCKKQGVAEFRDADTLIVITDQVSHTKFLAAKRSLRRNGHQLMIMVPRAGLATFRRMIDAFEDQ